MENIEIIVLLLFGVSFLTVVSARRNFPLPIALIIVGLLISFIPGLPVIILDPELVFFVFLPPLLYEAAWKASWHEFKANIRPITMAAVGLVVFTTLCVGWAVHSLIDGISWAEAFLLGAIVSPPDAVAATSVTKGLGLSPRIISILEGESLLNDASGLIVYRYALAAILTGAFNIWEAGYQFLLVVGIGVGIGLGIGYTLYLIHKNFVTEALADVSLTFLTPFASYLLAEHFHGSGVLAVVTTGLYLSYRSADMFTTDSRVQTYAVWEFVGFILNGLIFILLGLQMKMVLADLDSLTTHGIWVLIGYGLVVSIVVILVRFIWLTPAAILPRQLFNRHNERELFDRRNLVVIGWSGMRGVVSMAIALSIPLTLPNGDLFPNRNLVIFLTFCVIIVTLVAQGLTLPWVIRKLKMPRYSILAEEYEVRSRVLSAVMTHIEENMSDVDDVVLKRIKSSYQNRFERLQHTELPLPEKEQKFSETPALRIFNLFSRVQLEVIDVERSILQQLHREGKSNEEVLRKIESELDIEETRLQIELVK